MMNAPSRSLSCAAALKMRREYDENSRQKFQRFSACELTNRSRMQRAFTTREHRARVTVSWCQSSVARLRDASHACISVPHNGTVASLFAGLVAGKRQLVV